MLPIIGALIGQGLNILAGAVAAKGKDLIQDKLGIDIDAALGSEEGRLKLRQAEIDHEEFLTQAAANADAAAYADTDSARKMQQSALAGDNRVAKEFIYWYAVFWSIFAAGYLLMITFFPVPEKNLRFADTTLGFLLGTIISQLLQFFYGSTVRNRGKDTTIAALVEKAK